ncbi:hypothetical protein ACO0R3_000759 [Hanseniaspora guilliermondii]
MSDLDDDLLALADGLDIENDLEEESPHNSKHDSLENNNDVDDSDEDDDYNFLQKQSSNKSKENENELQHPFPFEEFYLDRDDRDRILALPEFEQQEIMYEREQKIKEYKERAYFLNRKKQQEQASRKRNADIDYSDEDDDDDEYEAKPSRAKRLKSLVKNKSYTPSDEEISEHEDSSDDYSYTSSRTSRSSRKSNVEWDDDSTRIKDPTLQDYNNIKIGRKDIDKLCFYPGFNKMIVGMYGRVNVSATPNQSQYRMVKIERVFFQKPYKFNNFYTNQYFGVTQGKFKKVFKMNYFSDSLITEQELFKYNSYLSQQKLPTAKRSELLAKFREWTAFDKQPLTDELLNQQVANRLQFNKKLSGVNSVIEKSVLKDKLSYAIDTNNEADINKYTKQLRQLEKRLSQYDKHHENDLVGTTKLNTLSEKNKKINIDNIRSKRQEEQQKQEANEMKDKKSDPFSRLKTKARIYYKNLQKIENEKAMREEEELKQERLKKEIQEQEERQYLEMIKSKFKKRGGVEFLVKNIKIDMELEL